MNAIPCVDVVVPVFNGRETIQTALFSVLSGQGGLVRRIIVVDDGSVDGTADAVKSLGNPLIQIVRTANRGVAQARNLGITESSAEWVAFLDADDMWLPGKLQAQLAAAEEHCAGFVSCSIGAQSVMKSGLISAKALARRGNFVATSSVLVKRSVLKQISPVFTPTMSFAEDYLAWLKCVALTRGYHISTRFVDYSVSEIPRYRWGQILGNIFWMNLQYASFLKIIDARPAQRFDLVLSVFSGSLRSVMSIVKRFFISYWR